MPPGLDEVSRHDRIRRRIHEASISRNSATPESLPTPTSLMSSNPASSHPLEQAVLQSIRVIFERNSTNAPECLDRRTGEHLVFSAFDIHLQQVDLRSPSRSRSVSATRRRRTDRRRPFGQHASRLAHAVPVIHRALAYLSVRGTTLASRLGVRAGSARSSSSTARASGNGSTATILAPARDGRRTA